MDGIRKRLRKRKSDTPPSILQLRKTLFSQSPRAAVQKPSSGGESSTAPNTEPIQVILRLRPIPVDQRSEHVAVEVEDGRTVHLIPPPNSNMRKTQSKRGDGRYIFSAVCGPEVSQKRFFDLTTLPLIKDMFFGKNTFLFAYGVTGSGKTFTITGTKEDCGLLPRALDCIFSSIDNLQTDSLVKPVGLHKVEFYSEAKAEVVEARSIINVPDTTMEIENSHPQRAAEMLLDDPYAGFDLEVEVPTLADNEVVDVDMQFRYAVWMTCGELYNDKPYDLLVDPPSSKEKMFGKRRQLLEVSRQGHIQGLLECRVRDMMDALKVLRRAERNRQVFSTLLNSSSSRSHAIYTIKVVKLPVKNGHILEDERVAQVSAISICDLAGSERYKNTQNEGDRLKEAGHINNSLMALHNCMKDLRLKRQQPEKNTRVAYNANKLTKLLEPYFEGSGKAVMIVNVNPSVACFDETAHVFEFSSVAKEVTSVQQILPRIDTGLADLRKRQLIPKKPVIPLQPVQPTVKAAINNRPQQQQQQQQQQRYGYERNNDDDDEEEEDGDEDDEGDDDGDDDETQIRLETALVERLTRDLAIAKAQLEQAEANRIRVNEQYIESFKKMEAMYKSQLRLQSNQTDEKYERKFDIIAKTPMKNNNPTSLGSDEVVQLHQQINLLQVHLTEARTNLVDRQNFVEKLQQSQGILEAQLDEQQRQNQQLIDRIAMLEKERDHQAAQHRRALKDEEAKYIGRLQEYSQQMEEKIVNVRDAVGRAHEEEMSELERTLQQTQHELAEQTKHNELLTVYLKERDDLLAAYETNGSSSATAVKKNGTIATNAITRAAAKVLHHRARDADVKYPDVEQIRGALPLGSPSKVAIKETDLVKKKANGHKEAQYGQYQAEVVTREGEELINHTFAGPIHVTQTGGVSVQFTEEVVTSKRNIDSEQSQQNDREAKRQRRRALNAQEDQEESRPRRRLRSQAVELF